MAAGQSEMIWGYLLHLGYNMWADRQDSEWELEHIGAHDHLRCDDTVWNDVLDRLVGVGANMVVIDLGEGVRYDSHPELAVDGSWTPNHLRERLDHMRGLGLEPIPKMNFSTAHDTWLGPYGRMISTDTYYQVCGELIDEAIQLFDNPRLFHLGMDEETADHQRHYNYAVMRQHELWWHDFLWMVDQVESAGSRPWIWSDYVWHHPELFYDQMPQSVLQSNWYYAPEFPEDNTGVKAYEELNDHGFEQVPTGSNWSSPKNMPGTVTHCLETVDASLLKGFLQTPWKPTLEVCRDRHEQAVDLLGDARSIWIDNQG